MSGYNLQQMHMVQLHPGKEAALTPGKTLKIFLSCPEL